MPVSAIVGSSLSTASIIFNYPRTTINGQVKSARVIAKPLIPFILAIDIDQIKGWSLFTSWAEKNLGRLDRSDEWQQFLDINIKVTTASVEGMVLRCNAGSIDLGTFSAPSKPGERSVFNIVGSSAIAHPLSKYLVDNLVEWCKHGPSASVDWLSASEFDLGIFDIECRVPLKIVKNTTEKWNSLLDYWRDLADSRMNAKPDELEAYRSNMIGSLILTCQGMQISPQMATLIEAQGGSGPMLLAVVGRMRDEVAPTINLRDAGDKKLIPSWRNFANRTGSVNYVMSLNVRIPGATSVTYDDVEIM
ncbi:VP11 [Kundal virus]|uniref:VP11 n=1 Tax=Kundal virus TaxID=2290890 RepID=A0A499RQU6_9REOV|nr:VP11 [Kundal virus]AXG65504.1 VP11 [Kundal virus]